MERLPWLGRLLGFAEASWSAEAAGAMAVKLGLPGLLGPARRERDLALAMIVSRVVAPSSKLAAVVWWGDVTLGADLGVAGATTDEAYAAMDWLVSRQDSIEKQLAAGPGLLPRREERPAADRVRAAHRPGRPVAVRVFPGNTGDPTAFAGIVTVVRQTFGLQKSHGRGLRHDHRRPDHRPEQADDDGQDAGRAGGQSQGQGKAASSRQSGDGGAAGEKAGMPGGQYGGSPRCALRRSAS